MSIEVRGRVVVITGTFKRPRQELSDALVALGAKVSDSVGAKTAALFAGEKAGSKLAKAKALGVPVFGEDELVALLAEAAGGGAAKVAWADWEALAQASDALAAARKLVEGDWSGFVAERDLEPLRALLARAAQRGGVTAVHRAAGARLRERGAQVVHPFGHFTPIGSVGLSGDGRYLATGSWTGDDYERGGTLVIWDVAAGRCVNVLPAEGGVGWPDFARCVQWSPDGRTVGAVFGTNGVGAFDAFGERQEARAVAYVTNGWSRPPGFVWAEDGARVLIACWGEDSKIPGTIVRLDRGVTDERTATWFRGPPDPRMPGELSIGYGASPGWSAEGLLIFSASSVLFAVREQDGAVAWIREQAGVEWFPDRRRMLICAGESLEIAATADGKTLASGRTGLSEYAVRTGVDGRFVLYATGQDDDGRGGFEVWRGAERIAASDMSLCPGHYSQPDFAPVALSPDGRRLALLTDERRLVVVAVDDVGRPISASGPFAGAMGVLYGADDTVVVVGPESLAFVEAGSGAVRGAFALLAEAPGERPLVAANGADLGDLFPRNPTFAVGPDDDRAWCVGFAEGVVVCPERHRGLVEETVALVVDRRWAWPLAWSDVAVVETAAEAAATLTGPQAKALRRAFPAGKPRKAAKPREVWPPAERGGIEEVFAVLLEAMQPLHGGWQFHVAEYLRQAAQTAAELGRADLAEAALARMPAGDYGHEAVAALGRCAAIVAAKDPGQARTWQARAEALAREIAPTYDLGRLKLAAGLGAGRAALGEARAAEQAFEKARGLLDPEVNKGEHTAELTSALALGGQVEAAIELFAARTDSLKFGWHFSRWAVEAMLRRGGAQAWRRLYAGLKARGCEMTYSEIFGAAARELGALGEWNAALEASAQAEGIWCWPFEAAAVRGMGRAGKVEEALARAQLFAAEKGLSPRDRAAWAEVMAEVAPDKVRARAQAEARTVEVDDPAAMRACVGALVRVGALDDAVALVQRAQGTVRVDAAATAALTAGDPGFTRRVTAGIVHAPAQEEKGARAWARLSAALRRAGEPEQAQACLVTACDGLKDPSRKRWVLEAALGELVEVGDLTGGHAMLARFPRASRHRPARALAEGCARHGHFRGAAELLRGLPGDDLNDRPQAAFYCFMHAAMRTRHGEPLAWS